MDKVELFVVFEDRIHLEKSNKSHRKVLTPATEFQDQYLVSIFVEFKVLQEHELHQRENQI